MSKRLKRIICWSLALAFMAGSGLLGYLMAANAPSVLKEEEIEAAQEEERIGIDCIVTKEYRYTVCGHKEQEESAVDRELVSMTEEEVEAHFPEFAIQSFSADRLELVRRIPQYCPKHYVLKLEDKALNVYQTQAKTGEQKVVETLSISTDKIPSAQRSSLTQGKVFSDLQTIFKYVREMTAKQ